MSTNDNGQRTTDEVKSVPAWLQRLWSELLFPGRSAEPAPLRWSAVALLAFVPGFLLYPSLGFHLFEPDEGRYAQIAREMLERGDWLVPHLQSQPYLDKPPLLYWLVMFSYSVFGVADWAARLPPALAAHACILLTYVLGRRTLGERSAFWGALLLGLSPGFMGVGRLLLLDALLTLWVVLSLFGALEAVRGERLDWRWWLAAAAACGLGVLSKGPIALVLLAVPIISYAWFTDRLRLFTLRCCGAFLGVVLALTLPWYVAICWRLPEFGRDFFWRHNLVRFLSPFDHLEPIWFYVPILFAGLLPGSLLIVPLARHLLTADPSAARSRRPELGFMVLAAGWCVLFFSLSGCKLATYVLPALPFLALILGDFLVQTRRTRGLLTATGTALMFVLLALGQHVVLPWYAEFRSPFSRPEQVQRYCAELATPVVCYPRPCDSVAFYVGRCDFLQFRSKETPALIEFCKQQPRTVILFTHRHSLGTLEQVLPPKELQMVVKQPLFDSARAGLEGWKYLFDKSPLGSNLRDETAGLCYLAVVQRK